MKDNFYKTPDSSLEKEQNKVQLPISLWFVLFIVLLMLIYYLIPNALMMFSSKLSFGALSKVDIPFYDMLWIHKRTLPYSFILITTIIIMREFNL